MTAVREMLDATMLEASVDLNQLARTLEALLDCERTSTACAGAMLGETDSGTMTTAIQADTDLVDVCHATRRIMTRSSTPDSSLVRVLLESCMVAGDRSYAECSKHAHHHAHCRLCSETTRRCIDACRSLLAGLRD